MSEDYFDGFMDYQIMSDYLISNANRHMNNIAVLRNPDTLELLGFTPIYDSGNSMFYNVPYEHLSQIRIDQIKTHSFVEREAKLLRYVKNRQSIDLDKVDMDFSIYEQDVKERHIRIPLLNNLFERKKDRLSAFQNGVDIWKDAQYR